MWIKKHNGSRIFSNNFKHSYLLKALKMGLKLFSAFKNNIFSKYRKAIYFSTIYSISINSLYVKEVLVSWADCLYVPRVALIKHKSAYRILKMAFMFPLIRNITKTLLMLSTKYKNSMNAVSFYPSYAILSQKKHKFFIV